jgi:hypothetical protein
MGIGFKIKEVMCGDCTLLQSGLHMQSIKHDASEWWHFVPEGLLDHGEQQAAIPAQVPSPFPCLYFGHETYHRLAFIIVLSLFLIPGA